MDIHYYVRIIWGHNFLWKTWLQCAYC
jgi:hypothetical protein